MGEKVNGAGVTDQAPAGSTGAHEGTGMEGTALADFAQGAGVGDEPGQSSKPAGQPPAPPGSWEGQDEYPDGYTMIRTIDGEIWLKGEGWSAKWDADRNVWMDPRNNEPMPPDWGGGHRPGKG